MTMPPPLQDRQYPKKMSTGNKVLIGCGIGCGTLIILVIIAIGLGAWWFFSSEEQVPTNRILNTGSSAAFRLEDISQNQEVMQLISDIIKEAQRINQERSPVQLPEPLEKLRRFSERQQDPTQFIKWFSPKEATVSISADEAGNPVFTLAANFGTGTRMVKMILNTAFESDKHLRDNKISTEHGDLFLFDGENEWNNDKSQQGILGIYKGTFIFSNDPESAMSALDQLAGESNAGELKEALSDPFYRMSQKGCLTYGVLEGSFFKNPNHGTGLFPNELDSEIKQMEISLDNLSSENGTLSLHIDWNNKESAAKANEEIEKLKPEWVNEAEQNGFDMEIMNSLKDKELDIQFQVNNLKDSFIYLIQNIE